MFGLGKDKNIITKNITRKYKNARITLLDAKYRREDDVEIMLDSENIDKLLSDINRAIEDNQSKYNPIGKRIIIADNEESVNKYLHTENPTELKQTILKDDFIEVYEPHYSFEDVYINEKEKKQILNVLNIKKHEEKLQNEWGFAKKTNAEKALVLNFFGAPGTGKSMAAQAVAEYLNKKVYSINYAELESKYVGQTPKNVKKAFELAKADDAVLVFEEADSFLGKRLTSISQSADYNVNLTRSVMLLELEKFEGIVIFTTNLLENYDEAFKRRILCSVEFKIPDFDGRKEIFKLHIPEKMPLSEDLNEEVLAEKLDGITGADIKDIVFMAAVYALEKEKQEVSFEEFQEAFNDIKSRY